MDYNGKREFNGDKMNDIPLKVEIIKQNDIAIIELAANFYTSNTMAHNLKNSLIELFQKGYKYIIIDMKEVVSIDSEGLGALSYGYKHCIDQEGNLVICNLVNRDVADVIEIVNLDKVIPFYDTRQEAIEKIKEN
jgi:anti-anti-sigma factor